MKKIDNTYSITPQGVVMNTVKNKELSQSINNGYKVVSLYRKIKRLHRLLAIAFIPNPLKLPLINHKDGNKLNNSLDNLEWCDYSHNIQHAYDTGLRKPTTGKCTGTKHGQSYFDKEDIIEIRRLGSYMKQKDIAKLYRCHTSIIQRIIARKSYQDIP